MATDLLRWYTLASGARLVVERMPGTRSCAAVWMLPVGTASDPEGDAGEGEATVLSELILRGAAGKSSRDISDAFDALGAQRHGAAAVHHTMLSTLCMGERIEEAMRLLSLVVRQPHLDADALESVRAIALQALNGLEDEPQHLAGVRLRKEVTAGGGVRDHDSFAGPTECHHVFANHVASTNSMNSGWIHGLSCAGGHCRGQAQCGSTGRIKLAYVMRFRDVNVKLR